MPSVTTRLAAAHPHALLLGTSLLLLAAACARKDATGDTSAATSASATAPSSTSSASSGGTTQAQKQDLHDDIRGYRLSEGTVDKVITATQKLRALQKSNPQLAATMEREHGNGSDAKSTDDAATHLDAIPPVKAVFSSLGLSSRDYVLTMFTLMEAGAAYQFQKAGKLPPNSELAKDVSPENMAYVGAHQAQLQSLERANADANGGED